MAPTRTRSAGRRPRGTLREQQPEEPAKKKLQEGRQGSADRDRRAARAGAHRPPPEPARRPSRPRRPAATEPAPRPPTRPTRRTPPTPTPAGAGRRASTDQEGHLLQAHERSAEPKPVEPRARRRPASAAAPPAPAGLRAVPLHLQPLLPSAGTCAAAEPTGRCSRRRHRRRPALPSRPADAPGGPPLSPSGKPIPPPPGPPLSRTGKPIPPPPGPGGRGRPPGRTPGAGRSTGGRGPGGPRPGGGPGGGFNRRPAVAPPAARWWSRGGPGGRGRPGGASSVRRDARVVVVATAKTPADGHAELHAGKRTGARGRHRHRARLDPQDLGARLNRTAADVVRFLLQQGEMVTATQSLPDEMIELFADRGRRRDLARRPRPGAGGRAPQGARGARRRGRGSRRRCRTARRSSPSWVTSTTARPSCSTASATPTSSTARPVASPSTSAPTRSTRTAVR